MNRKWTTLAWTLALVLAVTLVACGPKDKPTVAPQMDIEEREAPATTVAPAPTPSTMDDSTKDQLPKDLLELNRAVVEQGLIGDVYFDFDKYELRQDARDRLRKNAEFMKAYPEYVFSVEGHCDERGTNEYNLALGDRRASSARNYIGSLGVTDTRLRTITYGEEKPTCMEGHEGCWSRNRRARFVITGRS